MNKEKVANFYGSARLQLPLDGRNFDDFFLKVRNLYQSAGLQLPMEGKAFQDLFGSSIKTEEDLVKLKNQNTAMYQQSDRTTKGSIASDPQVQGRKIISIWRLPTNPPL